MPYGQGQLLGAGISPQLFLQDYSGFARAGETQGAMMQNLGTQIGANIKEYGDKKKQAKQQITAASQTAKAISQLIPELKPVLDQQVELMGDEGLTLWDRQAAAQSIGDILQLGTAEIRGRAERGMLRGIIETTDPQGRRRQMGYSGEGIAPIEHFLYGEGAGPLPQEPGISGDVLPPPDGVPVQGTPIGPFDENGNYREDWADDPTKWQRPAVEPQAQAAGGEWGVIQENTEGMVLTSEQVAEKQAQGYELEGMPAANGGFFVTKQKIKPKTQDESVEFEQNVRYGGLLGQQNKKTKEFKPYPGQTGGRITRFNPETGQFEQLEGKAAQDELSKAPTLKVESGQAVVADPTTETGTRIVDVPGGASEAEKQKQQSAKQKMSDLAAQATGAYLKLQEVGGAIDPSNTTIENIGARLAASGVGQQIAGAVGSQAQQFRDEINTMRPALINAIREATGMSAKAMDSDRELQFYLQTVSDPTKLLVANLKALDTLDKQYGTGNAVREMLKVDPKLYSQVVAYKLTPPKAGEETVIDEDVESILKKRGL